MESVGAERGGVPGLRLSELSLGVDPCDPDACAALRKAAHDLQLCSLALTPSSSAASSSLGSRAASASARPRSRHARTHARRPRPDWPSCRLSLQGRPAGEVSGAQRALFELVSGMTESLSCSSAAEGPGAAAAAGGDAPPSAPRHAPSPFVFECASPPPPSPARLRAPPPSAQMHYASMERSPVACGGYGGGQRCMAPFHKGHRDLDSSSAGSDADAGARVVDWRVLRQPRSQLPRGRSPPRRAGTTAAKGQRGSRRRGRKSPRRRRRRRRRRAGARTGSTAAAPRRRRRRGRGGKRRGNKARLGLGLGLGLLAEARGDSDAEEVSLAGAGAGRSNVYAEQLARMAAEDSARHAGPIAAAARVAMHKRKTRRGSPVRASARARGRAVGASGGGRQLSPRRPVATSGPGAAPRARLTRSPDGRRVLSLQLGPAVRCPPGSPGSARARSAPRSAQRGATPRRTTRCVDAGELSSSSTVNTLVQLPPASSLYCCTPLCGSPPATPTLMHPSRLEVSAYANALASGGGGALGGGGGDGAAVRTAVEGAGAPPAEGAAPAAPDDSSLAFWLRLICGPRKDGRAMGSLLRSQQVFAECARLLSCNPPLPPARLPPRRSPDAEDEEECGVRCWQRPRARLGRRRRLLRPRLPSAPALPGAMGPSHGGCRAAAFRVRRQRPHAARGALRRALQVMSVAFAPAPAPSERPATPDPTPACPPAEWPLFAAPALAPSPDSSALSAPDDKLCGSRWAALAAAKNIWARADGGTGSSSGLTPPASAPQAPTAPAPAPGPQAPTAAPDATPAPMDSALPKLPVYVLPHAASKIKLDRPSAPGSPAVQRFGLPGARPPPYASASAAAAAPAPRPGGPLPRDGEW